jgi:hypothetical protein
MRPWEPVNVLLLTGAPGVGKTTLAEEMFDQLAARGIRHAVDVDSLCMSFPFRPGDHCWQEEPARRRREAGQAGHGPVEAEKPAQTPRDGEQRHRARKWC